MKFGLSPTRKTVHSNEWLQISMNNVLYPMWSPMHWNLCRSSFIQFNQQFANSGSERYVCLYSVVWARIHGKRKAGMVKSVVKLMEQQLSYVPQSIRDANEYIHNSWVCSALTVNICYREIRLLFVYERATAWVGRLTINFSSNSHSYLRAWNYCIADNVPNFVYWTR